MTNIDFKTLHRNTFETEVSNILEKEALTLGEIVKTLRKDMPFLNWTRRNVVKYLDEMSFAKDENSDKWFSIENVIRNSKGRCFQVSWKTNKGYVRTMNAKLHPNFENGKYIRIVSTKNPSMIRNMNPNTVQYAAIDGMKLTKKVA